MLLSCDTFSSVLLTVAAYNSCYIEYDMLIFQMLTIVVYCQLFPISCYKQLLKFVLNFSYWPFFMLIAVTGISKVSQDFLLALSFPTLPVLLAIENPATCCHSLCVPSNVIAIRWWERFPPLVSVGCVFCKYEYLSVVKWDAC